MDPAAFTQINQAVLLATLRDIAEHSFSGDVEFRLEGRQILQRGKITKIRSTDRTEHWQMIHE